MTLFAEITRFLDLSEGHKNDQNASELLQKAHNLLSGYMFLVSELEATIVSAPEKINSTAVEERALADRLYEALSKMCSTRGILPDDIELICGALEAYDAARKQNTGKTSSDMDLQ